MLFLKVFGIAFFAMLVATRKTMKRTYTYNGFCILLA